MSFEIKIISLYIEKKLAILCSKLLVEWIGDAIYLSIGFCMQTFNPQINLDRVFNVLFITTNTITQKQYIGQLRMAMKYSKSYLNFKQNAFNGHGVLFNG